MDYDDEDEWGDYVPHVTFDPDRAAIYALRRDMDNLAVRMTIVRDLHGTWPDNVGHAHAILWHYGSRAIAGDY